MEMERRESVLVDADVDVGIKVPKVRKRREVI